jgi:hypothetical protein
MGYHKISQTASTLNQRVHGSNPCAPTIKIKDLPPEVVNHNAIRVTFGVTAAPKFGGVAFPRLS